MTEVARKIRNRRKQLRLSQEALAELANVEQSQISKYERGENEPGADVIRNLAQALETTTDYLLSLTEYPERPLRTQHDLSADELELLHVYRDKSRDKRQIVIDVVKAI